MTDDELHSWMQSLRSRIDFLKAALDALGFQFTYPDEAFPGVPAGTDDAIAKIESQVGTIPSALKAFYREIGSVNFCGHHPEWHGCDYPDPLVIYPPEAAISQLDEYLDDREEHDKWYGGFRIPIAPDYYHKEDVSGGMWYGVAVPAVASDPPLLEEHHNTTLLGYINLSMNWGGFLGLENADCDSTWPLDTLRNAANKKT